jgi:hypothetical protein
MLQLVRSTFSSIMRPRTALALTLIAAVACADRVATEPPHAATQRASTGASSDYSGTPAISVTPTAIGWGSVALGLATSGRVIKITSTGTAPLAVYHLILGGTNPGDFLIDTDGCSGTTLLPGASCTAYVSFEPLGLGTRTATVTIVDNAGSTTVSLRGTGVQGGPYIP